MYRLRDHIANPGSTGYPVSGHARDRLLTAGVVLLNNCHDVIMIAAGPITNGSKMTTVAEAAKVLDVTPGRVRRFINEGRLKALRVNARLYLVDVDDLARFRKLQREPGNPTFKKPRQRVDN